MFLFSIFILLQAQAQAARAATQVGIIS